MIYQEKDLNKEIEKDVFAESLKSERQALFIDKIIAFLSFTLALVLFGYHLIKGRISFAHLNTAIFFLFLFMFFYATNKFLFTIKNIKALRVCCVMIETLTVTIAMFIIYSGDKVENMFLSPLFLFYFVVIVISGFRYSVKLTIFATVISVIQYFILYAAFCRDIPVDIQQIFIDLQFPGIIQRISYLLLCGGICSVITYKTRDVSINMFNTKNKQNDLKDVFGQYISRNVLNYILETSNEITAAEKYGTVLFSDIRDFTTHMEEESPDHMISQLNEYFTCMGDIVERNGGFINKFVGDAIVAVFGILVDKGAATSTTKTEVSHSELATKSAVEMIQALEKLNTKWERENRRKFRIGIGVHSGNIILGNIGCENRMEFNCLGETVNKAIEIENLTKKFVADIIISGKVYSNISSHSNAIFSQLNLKVCDFKIPAVIENEILYEYVPAIGAGI